MKTTLILSTLVLFAALMGCSDNLNITDPSNGNSYSTGSMNHNSTTGDYDGQITLVWKLEEFGVTASGEYKVESKEIYTNPPFTEMANYLITFDVYTDADKFTNGYRPLVQVYIDQETVFESGEFPDATGNVLSSKEIRLENVRFTNLTFYVALYQGDGPTPIEDGTDVTLRLSNIRISTFE